MTKYGPVETKVDFPALEEQILRFWKEERIFERSLELRAGSPEWVFYEGPPTANGLPGIHHVEARTFKDVYPRFRTMTGHSVARKAGWDCHGIPVEVEIEKRIGTKSKRDIETFGIAEFNRLCRESVKEYVDEWDRLSQRIGFWIDLEDAYWTMDSDYIQCVWWALQKLHRSGLLFRDDKVTAYCPRCGTPLSDHEVAMGYTQITDPSVYVRFPVLEEGPPAVQGASLVAWTTTPWTLISNLGLVVRDDAFYAVVERGGERVVLAEAAVGRVLGQDATTLATIPGRDLVGIRYAEPFPNVTDGSVHRVVAGPHVDVEEGTGIVHMATAFGAEDLEVGRRHGWPVFKPVDDESRFTDLAAPLVRGLFFKDADPVIVEDLERRGLMLRAETIQHTYPLCWRCETPLMYVARPAWYIRTTAVKDRLLEVNEAVNWYPDHIKHGRYGDWLANNVDWSLSRERYWGTPLPIWVCPEGHEASVGSLRELSELAGRDVTGMDPHRPSIDEITFPCPSCEGQATRVPYLIDVWFDAGAMPYAQWGYAGPGSDPQAQAWFDARFPADFIAEGIDQTRGWFYTLMAEGVLLFDSTTYRNAVCLGLIVDAEGRKMSKRLGNIIDPFAAIDRFGADAVRWFFVAGGSPWAARRLSMEAIEDVVRRFLLTLWNTYAFYVTYANIDDPDLSRAPEPADRPVLDRWALSQLHGTIGHVREAMASYDATDAARRIAQLVDDLSNWYVRRSRRRFWDPARAGTVDLVADKLAAYATLEKCLRVVAGLMAPIAPFVSEALYRNLAGADAAAAPSIHMTDFPVADPGLVDPALDQAMVAVRQIVSLCRTVRTDAKVRVRQPLARAVVHVPPSLASVEPLIGLVAEEINVKDVSLAGSAEELSGWTAKPDFRVLGPRLGRQAQELAAALAGDDGTMAAALARGETLTVALPSGEVRVGPTDVELTQEARRGWGVASDGAVTVALDLELTDGLRREGMARELVHHAQALRKQAGLELTDRIVLGLESDDGEVGAAVDAFGSQIAAEVLAIDLARAAVHGATAVQEVRVDGAPVRLSLAEVPAR
jgi:isoleucyl-tRNA synthetase